MLSKSFNLEDIVNKSPIDNNNTNIDNKALNLKLNSLPSPKLPDLKDPKNKHILDKLENLPAEKKFIGIKKSRKEILLNIKNKSPSPGPGSKKKIIGVVCICFLIYLMVTHMSEVV